MPNFDWEILCPNYRCNFSGRISKYMKYGGRIIDLSIALVSTSKPNICLARGCFAEIHSSNSTCPAHDTSGMFGGFGIGYGRRS